MKNIFLAEDDADDRMFFEDALNEVDIPTQLTISNNGLELMSNLDILTVHPPPDVIFLDLNMPFKNGLECLKEMKNEEKLKDIFVAIYSTSDHENDVDETFKNGANIYITKPNDFSKLKQVLEKAVTTASQYRDSIMKRENFLLKI